MPRFRCVRYCILSDVQDYWQNKADGDTIDQKMVVLCTHPTLTDIESVSPLSVHLGYVFMYFFMVCLMKLSVADYIASNDGTTNELWIGKGKGYGRNQWWSNLRYCLILCLEGLRKTLKKLKVIRWTSLQAKVLNPWPAEYKAGVLQCAVCIQYHHHHFR
jgi:hypothetical protein